MPLEGILHLVENDQREPVRKPIGQVFFIFKKGVCPDKHLVVTEVPSLRGCLYRAFGVLEALCRWLSRKRIAA